MKPGKSCSSIKKRNIRITNCGKLIAGSGYKRHRMLRKNSRMVRNTNGNMLRSSAEKASIMRLLGR